MGEPVKFTRYMATIQRKGYIPKLTKFLVDGRFRKASKKT